LIRVGALQERPQSVSAQDTASAAAGDVGADTSAGGDVCGGLLLERLMGVVRPEFRAQGVRPAPRTLGVLLWRVPSALVRDGDQLAPDGVVRGPPHVVGR
jgi:hypothetical protein